LLQFFKTWLFSGTAFGLLWGAMMIRHFGVQGAAMAALPAGIAFGAAMAGFQVWLKRSQSARAQVAMPLQPGEQILHEGMANHCLGKEYRGGWLRLTNQRLAFRPHALNFQTGILDLKLDDIASSQAVLTKDIIPNGLKVHTRQGADEYFVVYGRKRWRDEIQKAIKLS